MTDETREYTATELLPYRAAALAAASQVAQGTGKSAAEVCHNAGAFMFFMLQGLPITDVGSVIVPGPAAPAADPTPAAKRAATRAANKAAADASAAATPATPAAPPAASPSPAPVAVAVATTAASTTATAAPAPSIVPPPVATAEVAVLCKQLIAKDRDALVALLKDYGATQLSQVGAAKLAEFAQKVRDKLAVKPASAVADILA